MSQTLGPCDVIEIDLKQQQKQKQVKTKRYRPSAIVN
jgi:hypothetical protein